MTQRIRPNQLYLYLAFKKRIRIWEKIPEFRRKNEKVLSITVDDLPNADVFWQEQQLYSLVPHIRNLHWSIHGLEVKFKNRGRKFILSDDFSKVDKYETIRGLFETLMPEVNSEEWDKATFIINLNTSVEAINALDQSVDDYLKEFVDDQLLKDEEARNQIPFYTFQQHVDTFLAFYTEVMQAEGNGVCNLSVAELRSFLQQHKYLLNKQFPFLLMEFVVLLFRTGLAEIKKVDCDIERDFNDYIITLLIPDPKKVNSESLRQGMGLISACEQVLLVELKDNLYIYDNSDKYLHRFLYRYFDKDHNQWRANCFSFKSKTYYATLLQSLLYLYENKLQCNLDNFISVYTRYQNSPLRATDKANFLTHKVNDLLRKFTNTCPHLKEIFIIKHNRRFSAKEWKYYITYNLPQKLSPPPGL